MKEPNPFVPWDESRIIGRREHFKAFEDFLGFVSAGNSGMFVLRGVPGSGKSSMIRKLREESLHHGFFSPAIRAEKNEKMDRVVKGLFQELDNEIMEKADTGTLPHEKADAFSKQKNVGTFRMLINNLWKTLGHSLTGVVFYIDDFDNVRKNEEMLRHIANVAAERRNIGFVVTTTKRLRRLPENTQELELGPVEEYEFRDYIAKSLKKEPKMGDECIKSVYDDSGGNPKLLKQVCWILYDRIKEGEKVITKAHYTANMRNIMSFLARDWFGRMYASASTQEKTVLKILARARKPLSVKESAKQLNKPMGPVATLLLRLDAKGQIIKVERGKYRIFSGLYAKYIRERG
jgi:hypothetical protein